MISIQNCIKDFNQGSVNEVRALNGISLDIQEGDFITVIGSNGSGKSTLLNVIAGVFFANQGRLVIDGQDVTKYPEYKRAKWIARVFQDPLQGTFSSGTIEQNMALALRRGAKRGLRQGVKPKDQPLFKERLQLLGLGLEKRLHDVVGLLSGGQRQAVTLLMATIRQPKILLLDEHTAALDPKTAHQVIELTDQLIEEQHLTALMVTHQMKHALDLGNRLIMMHQGQIIYDVAGKEKQKLKVEDLLNKFYEVQGNDISDRMLLA